MFGLLAVLATLSLTHADNGKVFTVPPRTAIVVTLVSNPSTGYRWKLAMPNDAPTRLVSQRYVAPKKSVPGAPGKEIWRFVVVGKRATALSFVYVRSWEPKKVARRFGVTIRVR